MPDVDQEGPGKTVWFKDLGRALAPNQAYKDSVYGSSFPHLGFMTSLLSTWFLCEKQQRRQLADQMSLQ